MLAVQTSDNPFKLRYVTEVRTPGKLDDTGPCVVLATPSMLQSGLSRELFDSWCEDARNGIIICDFAVQGTLAREIQGTPSHVITRAGAKVSLQSGCVCCCHLCNAGQNELATLPQGPKLTLLRSLGVYAHPTHWCAVGMRLKLLRRQSMFTVA